MHFYIRCEVLVAISNNRVAGAVTEAKEQRLGHLCCGRKIYNVWL